MADGDSGKFILTRGEQAGAQQLPPEIDPIRPRLVLADSVGGELVVFPALDFLRLPAGEHFGNVVEADVESTGLADAQHAAEQLLDIDGGVPFFSRMEAVVAGPAVFLGPDFAEIAHQADTAAGVVFGEVGHLVELVVGDVARLLVRDFLEEFEVFRHVAAGEKQQAVGGQAVAPGAAGFLVVALDVLRQVGVDDVADVGFVDAHAEGDGGADDLGLVAEEGVLVFRAFHLVEPGVIGDGGKSLRAQRGGERLGAFARLAIDDAGVVGPGAGEVAHLRGGSGFRDDLVFQIRPVEAGEEDGGIAQFELPDDVLADPLGGGGR